MDCGGQAVGLKGQLSAMLTQQTAKGVVIWFSPTDNITLLGVKKQQLSSKNFVFDNDDFGIA